MPQIERVIPVLTVKSLGKSLVFYQETLGFVIEWGGAEGDTICSIARDGQSIMLNQDSIEPSKSCVWVGLEDDTLFCRCRSHGVKVVLEPRNMPWAYEMKIEGPDGHVLWLGTGPKQEIPEI
jgi:predicted lactoylglutathione lyase